MSEHYHHFICGATQITLPVTPESYTWGTGKYIQQVNISELGDVNLPGNRKRYNGSFQSFFPATDYPWLAPGGRADPQYYVGIFGRWAESDDPVRYIVDGTSINALVLIEGFEYSEQDGSGDVYYKITLREWVDVEAVSVSTSTAGTTATHNSAQSVSPATAQQYTIVAGDTLSSICRRVYGNGTATYYNALAVYNGIKNPNLIYAGTVITLPPESELKSLFGQSPDSTAVQPAAVQAGGTTTTGGASGRSTAMIQLFG